MDPNQALSAVRAALDENVTRLCALLRAQPDLGMPNGNNSLWTVRDGAAHLVVVGNVYSELATGTPSPLTMENIGDLDKISAALIADIPEAAPDKLATLVREAMDRFLSTTDGWPGDAPLTWHCSIPMTLTEFTAAVLCETLIHGYDLACGLDAPWPISTEHALLVLGYTAPVMPLLLSPASAGHTAAYGVAFRGGPGITLRFTEGSLSLEPAGAAVDCDLDVDPVAFLLMLTGRLPKSAAFALGAIRAGGARPDLAAGFPDLFVYP